MKAHIVLLQLLLIFRTFPNRECALVREITKTFEQVIRGTAAELAARFAESEPKGECVIVISPCDNNIAADNTKLRETVGILLNAGIGAKTRQKSPQAF